MEYNFSGDNWIGVSVTELFDDQIGNEYLFIIHICGPYNDDNLQCNSIVDLS